MQGRRRYWVHPLCKERGKTGEFRMLHQILDDNEKCLAYFRMTRSSYQSLLELCGPRIKKQNTN